jgi:hypothetical protein
MSSMKQSVSAAMRARDVSRPRPEHERAAAAGFPAEPAGRLPGPGVTTGQAGPREPASAVAARPRAARQPVAQDRGHAGSATAQPSEPGGLPPPHSRVPRRAARRHRPRGGRR